MSYKTTGPNPHKAILLDSKLDEYSKEFESPDGFFTKFKADALNGILSLLIQTPGIKTFMNHTLTNMASTYGTNRPHQFSCKSSYTSYDSLRDQTFYGRHLGEADAEYIESLPKEEKVLELFQRINVGSEGGELQTMCHRSTMLFPTFAQHLIDSFIVTPVNKDDTPVNDTLDAIQFKWSRTDTPHDIGLLPLYGLKEEQTHQLRVKDPRKGQYGQMKSQIIHGEEYAPFLYDGQGKKKDEFNKLPEPQGLEFILKGLSKNDAIERKSKIFAFGGERTNLTPNISAWNILLLREHNRIARGVEKSEPSWDDERVFQTTRNIVLVIYLKLVIEEYIAHITAYGLNPYVEPGKWMWDAPWYKKNWISAEFAVLYRWHGLIPNCMKWGKETVSTEDALFNNGLILENMNYSLRDTFVNISNHRATVMNPFNTERWMIGRDKKALEQSRATKLKPYVDYCKYLGLRVPKKFSDISKDKEIQAKLQDIYGNVEKVEFFPGLIASDNPPDQIMSKAMQQFVANDAFNQALGQPLLSEHVWSNGEESFGKYGWDLVQKKHTIADILERNTNNGKPLKKEEFVEMTIPGARRKTTIPVLIALSIPVALIAAGVSYFLDSRK